MPDPCWRGFPGTPRVRTAFSTVTFRSGGLESEDKYYEFLIHPHLVFMNQDIFKLIVIPLYLGFMAWITWWIFKDHSKGKYVLKIYMNEEGLNNVKHIASMIGKSDVDTMRHSMGLLQLVIDIQTEGGEIIIHPKDEAPEVLKNLVGMDSGEEWKQG